MNNNVLVSVIMPVFNGEKYLVDAIESIIYQTYKNLEFIIIDDGSNDNSLSIIESYNDNRIVVIKNKSNFGLIRTLNIGVELSNGEYICRFDCDDFSYPDRVMRQVDFMEKNPKVALLGTWARIITPGFSFFNKYMRPQTQDKDIRFRMMFESAFIHPTVMLRTKIMSEFKYNEDYTHAEDYELWLRLSEKYIVSNLSEVLLDYRVHPSSISNVFSSEQRDKASLLRMKSIRLYSNSLGLSINESKFVGPHLSYLSFFNDFLKIYTEISDEATAKGVSFNTIRYYFWREHCRYAKFGFRVLYGYIKSPYRGRIYQILILSVLVLFKKSY